MHQVQKKDGSLENFDRNKIVNGVVKAGGSAEEAEKVAAAIEAWLPTVAGAGVVTSTQIRAKVLEVLRTVNPTVATNFENYQKPAEPAISTTAQKPEGVPAQSPVEESQPLVKEVNNPTPASQSPPTEPEAAPTTSPAATTPQPPPAQPETEEQSSGGV